MFRHVVSRTRCTVHYYELGREVANRPTGASCEAAARARFLGAMEQPRFRLQVACRFPAGLALGSV